MSKYSIVAAMFVLTSGIAVRTEAQASFAGYYKLTARHSGKAVVVLGASTANSADVIQYTYASGSPANDEWQFAGLGNGYYKVINRNSGRVLTVAGASTANGGDVVQYSYGGSNTNDEW